MKFLLNPFQRWRKRPAATNPRAGHPARPVPRTAQAGVSNVAPRPAVAAPLDPLEQARLDAASAAKKPFPSDMDPDVVDRQLGRDYESARQARQKAGEKESNDLRHALLPRDLPVLAALAAVCRLHYHHEGGYGWGRMSSTICKLIHPDGRVKVVSWSSVYRLQYWALIEACAELDGHFGRSHHEYALTAAGIARAATCTKSLEAIFKQPKAAKAAQPQETT